MAHATKDDPPLFLEHAGDLAPTPLAPGDKFGAWIHHPRFGDIMQLKSDELGLECRFYHRGKPAPADAEADFLGRNLLRGSRH
jgi:hypothetical protein